MQNSIQIMVLPSNLIQLNGIDKLWTFEVEASKWPKRQYHTLTPKTSTISVNFTGLVTCQQRPRVCATSEYPRESNFLLSCLFPRITARESPSIALIPSLLCGTALLCVGGNGNWRFHVLIPIKWCTTGLDPRADTHFFASKSKGLTVLVRSADLSAINRMTQRNSESSLTIRRRFEFG